MTDLTRRTFVQTAASGLLFSPAVGLVVAGNGAIEITNLNAPSRAEPGDTITVRGDVRNTGDREETVRIDYRIDGRIREFRKVTLDAGEETSLRLRPKIPNNLDPGTHTHGLFLAGSGSGTTGDIAISAPDEAVFTVSNFSGPSSAIRDEVVTAEARIRNDGTAAGSTEVQYRLAGQVVASQEVDLEAGASVDVSFDAAVPSVDAGTHRHGVLVGDSDRGNTTSFVVEAEPSPEPEPTPTPEPEPTPEPDPTPEPADGVFGPGFGPGAGVAGVAGAAGLARLYRLYVGEDDEPGGE